MVAQLSVPGVGEYPGLRPQRGKEGPDQGQQALCLRLTMQLGNMCRRLCEQLPRYASNCLGAICPC